MDIVHARIEEYLNALTPERDPILTEMEQVAEERSFPIVGPLVGRLCYQLVKLSGAERILEMGSGFGYSAFWMAQALPSGGRIILTEESHENLDLARGFFERGGMTEKADFRCGNALDILPQLTGQFDVIMNDIDKEDYPRSIDLILPRLRPGGVLLTDNALWHGRVTKQTHDLATQNIIDYTKKLYSSNQLFTTIVPLRDGVSISLKDLRD